MALDDVFPFDVKVDALFFFLALGVVLRLDVEIYALFLGGRISRAVAFGVGQAVAVVIAGDDRLEFEAAEVLEL